MQAECRVKLASAMLRRSRHCRFHRNLFLCEIHKVYSFFSFCLFCFYKSKKSVDFFISLSQTHFLKQYLFISPFPHRPHLPILWAVWQHSRRAMPPTDTSRSAPAETYSPQRPHLPLLWAVWQHSSRAMPPRDASESTSAETPFPHRPLLPILWAVWQHAWKAMPPTDTSRSAPAETHSPQRPHLPLLWAVWQHDRKVIPPTDTSSSTQAESHSPHRPHLPLLWAVWQHSGSTATATPWQHRDGNTAKHGSARQNIRQKFFVRKRLPAAVFLQIFLSLLYNHH